jgi:pyruvate/2-oxoglutarate dehydrogenase complex dihydrolipoamide dehydrogenase (E3) component
VAVMNALLRYPKKLNERRVTWCTFCDPELASVGESEDDLKKRAAKFETYRFPFGRIDRAVTDGAGTGLIKVFADKGSGKIYGACILGANAGEMISEYALAIQNGIGLQGISDTIHPYPTYGLGVRQTADQWVMGRLTPGLLWGIRVLFGLRGRATKWVE